MVSNTKNPIQQFQQMYRNDRHLWRLIFMIAIWMLFMAITRFSRFYTMINFQTMAAQFPEFGLMSLGVMLCMITGGIDLSVVGVANLTSILMAFILINLTTASGALPAYAMPLVFILAIILGAAFGLFNGLLVSKFHILKDICKHHQQPSFRSHPDSVDFLHHHGCIHLVSALKNSLWNQAVSAGNQRESSKIQRLEQYPALAANIHA